MDQFKSGESYSKLTDVVAISICDFVLWPDAEQDASGLARVPMLSRWSIAEQASGNHGLLQVQYAFLELPKLLAGRPESGADLWAWLFVHAPEMTEMPADLLAGPYRDAAELANEATFSQLELDAYRKVMDEIQQAREYGDAREARGETRGETRGEARGEARGKAAAVLAVLEARGVMVNTETRARIAACADVTTLGRWITRAATASSFEEVISEA